MIRTYLMSYAWKITVQRVQFISVVFFLLYFIFLNIFILIKLVKVPFDVVSLNNILLYCAFPASKLRIPLNHCKCYQSLLVFYTLLHPFALD